ncbi:MAG: hypothetical protein Q9168_002446 [Polycauliona sp. 1 TL-2023]
MTAPPSEADIIFNRANVALAKSQRLVASWLPPRTDNELKSAKTDEQIEKEEQEMFVPVPEVLGLGAKIPENLKDWDLKRPKLSSNDQLRRQLLGKDHAKLGVKGGFQQTALNDAGPSLQVGSKPRPRPVKRGLEDDSSDEEGGRASLGRKKVKKPAEDIETEQADHVGGGTKIKEERRDEQHGTEKPSGRARNYLDEVLSQNREKKRKSRRKKEKKDEGDLSATKLRSIPDH